MSPLDGSGTDERNPSSDNHLSANRPEAPAAGATRNATTPAQNDPLATLAAAIDNLPSEQRAALLRRLAGATDPNPSG